MQRRSPGSPNAASTRMLCRQRRPAVFRQRRRCRMHAPGGQERLRTEGRPHAGNQMGQTLARALSADPRRSTASETGPAPIASFHSLPPKSTRSSMCGSLTQQLHGTSPFPSKSDSAGRRLAEVVANFSWIRLEPCEGCLQRRHTHCAAGIPKPQSDHESHRPGIPTHLVPAAEADIVKRP
jgi:hypothetical protein